MPALAALAALPTAACVLDAEFRCLFANEAFAALMGEASERLAGARFEEILPPDQARRLIDLFASSEKNAAAQEGDLTLPFAGERRFRVFAARCDDPSSGEARFVAHVEDATWRALLEREIILARDMAESAARAKSEFIDNMTHELRTPLNGSIGMLDLLAATELTEEQRDYVDLSLGANRHLLEIINDILDYAKIVSGEFKLNEREFRPQDVILAVVGALKPQAESKGLSFHWSACEDLPCALVGDDARLRQILFNILGNAVKFTRAGEVRLSAKCEPDAEDARFCRLRFTVSDTGIGIPEEKLERIFDPFTQADGSYARSYQGAGLGLGIVKRLLDLMRGDIRMQSDPGKGTVAMFSAPVRVSGAISAPSADAPCPLSPSLKVLLAEDDGVNQIMISRMLEKMGHQVYCVENGVEALKALRGEAFDCILMDVRMPVMSGLDAARTIRTAPGFTNRCEIPIIGVTAQSLRGDRERFVKAGMDECLFKPFSMDELARMLAMVVVAPRESGA